MRTSRRHAARAVWSALLAALIVPSVSSAAPGRVELLPTSAALIRFAVEVPPAELRPVGDAADERDLQIEGFLEGAASGQPSSPARTVIVAVPPAGAVTVRGFASGGSEFSDVSLAPVPTVETKDGVTIERRVRAARFGAMPAPPAAELAAVSWIRNQRVAVVVIRPAAWDAATRRLAVSGRVEVEVSVDPAAAQRAWAPAERSDPFEGVYRTSVINYEQGRRWRRSDTVRPELELGGGRAGGPVMTATPETSLFAGRRWVKLAIPSTGFYKIEYGQFRGLAAFADADSVPLDSVRMFVWPGHPVLPEGSFCDSCVYEELPIQFSDLGGDGRLAVNGDEIYFFALGASDWLNLFDGTSPDSVFLNHPSSVSNYVYLTRASATAPIGGTPRRIPTQSVAVSVDGDETIPTAFDARAHFEVDDDPLTELSPKFFGADTSLNRLFWEKFFWRSLSVDQSFPVTLATPDPDPSAPGLFRARLWGFDADDCGNPDPPPSHQADVEWNGVLLPRFGWSGFRNPGFFEATVPIAGANSVVISIPIDPACLDRIDVTAIAWLQVYYRRLFRASGNELAFDTPAGGGHYIFRVDSFSVSVPPRVFDVTDPLDARELTGFDYDSVAAGRWRLSFEVVEGGRRRYRIVQPASITRIAGTDVRDAAIESMVNLRSRTVGADALIIYYDEFKSAADQLAEWRRDHLAIDGTTGPYEVLELPVSAVYDQFSGGRLDPVSIRNLLHAAYVNWARKPAFVTLLGDASYDFKNILGQSSLGRPGALVPSWQEGFALNKMFATDDWLMEVTGGQFVIPDFWGGRIPVTDAAQALEFVQQKIIRNEQSPSLGTFRNSVLLIADDDTQGAKDDGLHWAHLGQTADLDTARVPAHFDRDYVYLHKYPYDSNPPTSYTKPTAKEAIREYIKNGVAISNFFGHGSPFQIADEKVLLDTDAGTLDNADRLCLFVAASCDVGKYDDPQVPSLGERMVLARNGGALAVVSATELAYSSFNKNLADSIYTNLFRRSANSGQYFMSVAEALVRSKLTAIGIEATNNLKYQVMGDPASVIHLPRRSVELSLHACDTCTAQLGEITRGQKVTVRGRVTDSPGGPDATFNGVLDLLVEDSAPLEQAPPCRLARCTTLVTSRPLYYYRAGTVYRGDLRVVNGTFTGDFIVPLEAKGGARARVRAYVAGRVTGEGTDNDGAGSRFVQLSPGAPAPGDDAGPVITLSFSGGATTVKPDAVLQVDLFDPSGILLTGHNPQNGIVVTLDENTTTRVDITGSFRYAPGSFQSGTATFQLPGLPEGPHTVRVSAADNLAAGLTAAQHRSEALLGFEVAELPPLAIANAYLFPTPTHSRGAGAGGQFVVEARGDSLNALLRIYTISGKLVRTLKAFGRIGQVQIPWDGRDAEGDPLANGTYFFRVQVNIREDEGRSSARQVAHAEGRFVVLNR